MDRKDLMIWNEVDSVLDHFFGDRFRSDFSRALGNMLSCTWDFACMQPKGSFPKVNVVETENGYEVDIAIAGYYEDEVNLEFGHGQLTIDMRAMRDDDADTKYLMKEISYRNYYRTIKFPVEIDPESIEAVHKDGIIKIRMKKVKREKEALDMKKIDIKQ